jgi:hypothetical protein
MYIYAHKQYAIESVQNENLNYDFDIATQGMEQATDA